MTPSPADLDRIRAEVAGALGSFIGRKRGDLATIAPDLLACTDAITDLLAGGKRLRPAFCYWGWRARGGPDGAPVFAAAAALELLHASALVHDDVMDASETRRGQPAVHRRFAAMHRQAGWSGSADRFGAGAAILVGDLLLAWTDELIRHSGLPADAVERGLAVLDPMRTEVFAGQYLDLVAQASAASRDPAAQVQEALRVVTYKSAKYTVERPLHLGAALAGGDAAGQDPVTSALTGYGIPVGVAFQLRDDILGVFGDPAQTGKPVTDDLREGKRTVLLALAAERSDSAQERVLAGSVGNPDLTDAEAGRVREVISRTGALAECELMIEASVKQGLAALEGAPIMPEAGRALADLAVAATARLR
ncbi:MAG: polyprenyl synthetase family protein [Streptosporangiaceae bacterium]